MPQELVSQTTVFMSTLDESGNVGHRGFFVILQIHHADLRITRREGVGGDLGSGT